MAMKFEEGLTMSKWCTPLMLSLALNFMILTIFLTSWFNNGKKQLGRSPSMMLLKVKLIDMFQFAGCFNNNRCNERVQMSMDGEVENRFELREENEAATLTSLNERYDQQTVKVSVSSRSAFRKFREAEAASEYRPPMIEQQYGDTKEGATTTTTMTMTTTETGTETERSMDEVYIQLLQHQGSNMNRTKSDTEPASGAVPLKLGRKMKKSASSKSPFKHFEEAEIVEARRPATVKEATHKNEEDEEVDSKADDFISMFKQQLKLQRLDSILKYKEMLDRGASK